MLLRHEPHSKHVTTWGVVWLGSAGTYANATPEQAAELLALGFVPVVEEIRAVLPPPANTVQAVAVLPPPSVRRKG